MMTSMEHDVGTRPRGVSPLARAAGLLAATALAAAGLALTGGSPAAAAGGGGVGGWGRPDGGLMQIPDAARSGVIQIAAGAKHAVALKLDGTVVPWGRNDFHQTDVPAGLTGVTDIAAGTNFTLALTS